MSEPGSQMPPTVVPGPAAPGPARFPWVLIVVVGVVSLLVGVGGTTAAFLLYDRATVPEYTFHVSVFLRPGATDAEKEQVRSAIDAIDVAREVRYESREEAYERFKELFRDRPDLVESVRPDTLPESFRFRIEGTLVDFDCGILDPLQGLPAVDDIDASGKPEKEGTQPRFVSCA